MLTHEIQLALKLSFGIESCWEHGDRSYRSRNLKAINKSNHYKVHFSLDATRFAENLLFSNFAKPHIANQTPEPTETAKSFLGIFSTVNATPFFSCLQRISFIQTKAQVFLSIVSTIR
uniref:Uncharacterized protein n=1 Tax=Opuntia streptacantha TaxID=393608 RepID=A0A7C9CNY2_OPUST